MTTLTPEYEANIRQMQRLAETMNDAWTLDLCTKALDGDAQALREVGDAFKTTQHLMILHEEATAAGDTRLADLVAMALDGDDRAFMAFSIDADTIAEQNLAAFMCAPRGTRLVVLVTGEVVFVPVEGSVVLDDVLAIVACSGIERADVGWWTSGLVQYDDGDGSWHTKEGERIGTLPDVIRWACAGNVDVSAVADELSTAILNSVIALGPL